MKRTHKHFEPILVTLNKDASAVLCLVTIGCFIMTAAVLLQLFIGLE